MFLYRTWKNTWGTSWLYSWGQAIITGFKRQARNIYIFMDSLLNEVHVNRDPDERWTKK